VLPTPNTESRFNSITNPRCSTDCRQHGSMRNNFLVHQYRQASESSRRLDQTARHPSDATAHHATMHRASRSAQAERTRQRAAVRHLPGHLATTTTMDPVERLRSLTPPAAHGGRLTLLTTTSIGAAKVLRAVFHVGRFVRLLVAHFPSPAVCIRRRQTPGRASCRPSTIGGPPRAVRLLVAAPDKAIGVPIATASRCEVRN